MNLSFGNGTGNLLNTRVRRQKFGVGGLILLLFIGVIFTVVGLAGIASTKIKADWKRIDGTVTSYNVSNSVNNSTTSSSSSTTYPAIVAYTVDGQSYTVTSSTSSSARPTVGSTKQVAYNPQNPADAKVVSSSSTTAFLYIFPVIGILLLILGPVLFVKGLHRSKEIGNLQQTGQKVQGVISNIQSVGTTNNNTNYKVVVSAADPSGAVQYYTSDSLSGIGGLAMADFQTNPIPIDVYINPSNPKDYYVDISELPNLTPDRIRDLIGRASGQPTVQPSQQSQPPQLPPTPPNPPTTPPVNPVQ